jgi:large subunit ribosomal protein L6
MSRIGKLPIVVPASVQVQQDGQKITVSGPKWTLHYEVLPACSVAKVENTLVVSLVNHDLKNMWWLTRTLIANMVQWVSEWFEKKLHVMWIWYNVKVQWQTIELSLWLSHKVNHILPKWVTAVSEKDPKWNDIITITGADKQAVGQEAAKIKMYRKPEPYKWKWIRYFGEVIKLKAGKTWGKK